MPTHAIVSVSIESSFYKKYIFEYFNVHLAYHFTTSNRKWIWVKTETFWECMYVLKYFRKSHVYWKLKMRQYLIDFTYNTWQSYDTKNQVFSWFQSILFAHVLNLLSEQLPVICYQKLEWAKPCNLSAVAWNRPESCK